MTAPIHPQKIELIPIARIHVLNPRTRSRRQHREIVENIETIGLKRPVTVRRRPDDGEADYDLVCGEGRLTEQAEGQPLGAYIRSRLLDEPPRRKRLSEIDRDSLLRVLGQLGQSRIANNLNQLARAANLGTLPATPEAEDALIEASRDIAEIRALLIKALGMEATP